MHTPFSPHRFFVTLAAACILPFSASQASVLLTEKFQYVDGPLTGQNGGTGWPSAWQTYGQVDSQRAMLSGAQARRDYTMNTAATGGTGSLYFAFTLQNSNALGGAALFQLYDGNTEKMTVGQGKGKSFWGLHAKTAAGWYESTVSSRSKSVDHFILKITFGAEETGSVKLFINNTSETEPTSASGAVLEVTDITISQYTNIRLQAITDGGVTIAYYDDITVGTKWEDVAAIPEPSLAYVALGGLALLGAYRRWMV